MDDPIQNKKILTYDDVVIFGQGDSTEKLVDVKSYDDTIVTEYLKEDMLEITGETILVRDSLARKLAVVNGYLSNLGLLLKVVYGYRHPDVQKRYFDKRQAVLANENPGMSKDELDRLTHNFVAVPDVAGHPVGGAVDLTIIDKDGNEIDMGTQIADYADPQLIQTWDRRLTKEQRANRSLLHDAMLSEGFAPFYGEWWHFSYGDREWAAFYNKKALYGAVQVSIL